MKSTLPSPTMRPSSNPLTPCRAQRFAAGPLRPWHARHLLQRPPASLSGSAGGPQDASPSSPAGAAAVPSPASDNGVPPMYPPSEGAAAIKHSTDSFVTKVKNWFTGAKDQEKLASIGMAAFLSYGFVSNVTYGACLTIAWITFVKQKGITPLAAGQWAPFLAFYAGLWTIQNFVRPLRFAFSIAIAPFFDRLLNFVAASIGKDKKVAFPVCLGIMGVFTSVSLFSAIYLLGGLPDGLGPFPPLKRF